MPFVYKQMSMLQYYLVILFSGNLYESDLPILFNDTTCYAVQIRGSGLKKIVFSMSNENFLLISGIRIHRDSSDLYFLNNQKIRDDQLVYILIPEIYLDEYQDDIVAMGKSFSIINLLQEYFKTENKITPQKKDGRYGE